MIIYTKNGEKKEIPYLFAQQGGVWAFEFFGDETYVDPYDSSVWYWVGVTNDIDEIIGVAQGSDQLTLTSSVSDCVALQGSYYWDDTNGILYVHWVDSDGDWSISRDTSAMSAIVPGWANGYSRINQNVFDGVFYNPKMTNISGLSKKVDPLKLGLIAFNSSQYAISDQVDNYENTSGTDSVGNPVWFYLAEHSDTTLTDEMRIFTGIQNGYQHDRSEIRYNVVETRFFDNVPVCPNKISVDDFPNVGDNDEKIIPTAWGEIRRGIMLLTNKDSLTTAGAGSAIFLVSDPDLDVIRAIDAVYDKEDNDLTASITATNLTACTVTVTKAAGVSVGDLKDWTWAGEGYDIDGDFDNGLDILRAGFLYLTGIPYIASTFDTIIWDQETLNNPQSIGISLQKDKGFIESLIEPVTTSLQGVVEILGDGRISAAFRDTTEIPIVNIPHIYGYDQLDLPKILVDPKQTVSELNIEYAPNFKISDDKLSFVYTDDSETVIRDYSIDRRDPLSPVKTVLNDVSDVEDLAIEIMETSASPNRLIKAISINILTGVRLFSIIGIDTGVNGQENIEYGELLNLDPDYNKFTQSVDIRVIPDYSPLTYIQGWGYSNLPINSENDGYSSLPIGKISDGFGVTQYNN
jgi:hypothetical protein